MFKRGKKPGDGTAGYKPTDPLHRVGDQLLRRYVILVLAELLNEDMVLGEEPGPEML